MPPTVDKSIKRAEIISHAANEFSKRGFHVTKMQDVATSADIGKGTIYEYFATKEDLFLAVYDSWMTEYEATVQERVDAAEGALSKVDAIRESAVDFYQSRATQAPLLLEFWAHTLRTDNPAFLKRIDLHQEFLQELGAKLTRELIKAGWFQTVDAASFARMEVGISNGIFLTWVLQGQSFPLDKAYTFRQSILGYGLLNDEARSAIKEMLLTKLKKGF
ncbi:MAG: TetR/AcrR family transcriptional regulator [Ignavibacteria bacterium]|nr:TetR/AcrR family transcriptional regulator [Ignavibacteria bacterium]